MTSVMAARGWTAHAIGPVRLSVEVIRSRVETPAFGPGRKRRFTSSKCRRCSLVCSHVPYRLLPSPAQEAVLRDHCAHARFVWNLAVEQHRTGARAAPALPATWSSAGSSPPPGRAPVAGRRFPMVQQQALRDFAQAMAAFFDPENPARRPSWRKAGRTRDSGSSPPGPRCAPPVPPRRRGPRAEGRMGPVPLVPHGAAGREVLPVTLDRAGRWHVAFAVIPEPIAARLTGNRRHRPRSRRQRGPVHG